MRRTLALFLLLSTASVGAENITASPPRDLTITVYRAPNRGSGSIDLDGLEGFALISESREVILPPGDSRLRFEGVADGIEPASAIVTGLPSGVIEKNRDAALLSPSALVAAAVGKQVMLVRTDPKTGRATRIPGEIASDADGVVFKTVAGFEALRCSGLPESFNFEAGTTGLSARPTLSVLTKSDQPVRAMVTLSYLARGFDWAADYVATLSPDGRTIDLGAWVTLANSNGVGFLSANAQVVAGRLNRENGEIEPIDDGSAIVARCWPRGSTSDTPDQPSIERAVPLDAETYLIVMAPSLAMVAPPPVQALAEVIVTARKRVEEEQLGDLKLYRVPDRTTIASRQSKQVRLLDRQSIPIDRMYEADLWANSNSNSNYTPAHVLLRSRNDAAHHLGLPLPSGRVSVFQPEGRRKILVGEAGLRDTAIDEEVEIKLGDSPDVQVRQIEEEREQNGEYRFIPLAPGITLIKPDDLDDASRVEISNAGNRPIRFELRLQMDDGRSIVRADRPFGMKNGRPIFRLVVPANGSVTVRYQSATTSD